MTNKRVWEQEDFEGLVIEGNRAKTPTKESKVLNEDALTNTDRVVSDNNLNAGILSIALNYLFREREPLGPQPARPINPEEWSSPVESKTDQEEIEEENHSSDEVLEVEPFTVPHTPKNHALANMVASRLSEIPVEKLTPELRALSTQIGRHGPEFLLRGLHFFSPRERQIEAIKTLSMPILEYYSLILLLEMPISALTRNVVRGASLRELSAIEIESTASSATGRIIRQTQKTTGSSLAKGRAAEEALRRLTAGEQWRLQVSAQRSLGLNPPKGDRIIDQLGDTLLHESKNKYLYLDKGTREQISKDLWLWQQTGRRPFWHLFQGGSKPLKDELRRLDFMFRDYKIYPE